MASLKAKASETGDKAIIVLRDLKTKANEKKDEVVVLLRDPTFQTRSIATAGGTMVLGTVGGAFGLASGVVVGSAAGVVLALFTFGLSIPAGGVIGGIGGLCTGTLIGGACGGAGGLTIYNYRIQIKDRAMIVKVKAQENFNNAKQRVKATFNLAQEQVDARLRMLQNSVTDLACNAKKRSRAAVDLAKSKSSEAYSFATTTKAGVTTSAAVAGAVVGGTTTGAFGTLAGAAIGVVPAIFTFGLSIPAGAMIGCCIGTTVGGSVGAVGGGLVGYGGFTHRQVISENVQSSWSKVSSKAQEIKKQSVTCLVDAKQSMRSAVTGSTGCSENVAAKSD